MFGLEEEVKEAARLLVQWKKKVKARQITCPVCGREFTAVHPKASFCSHRCKLKFYYQKKKWQGKTLPFKEVMNHDN